MIFNKTYQVLFIYRFKSADTDIGLIPQVKGKFFNKFYLFIVHLSWSSAFRNVKFYLFFDNLIINIKQLMKVL